MSRQYAIATVVVLLLTSCARPIDNYQCTFHHLPGIYYTHGSQLASKGELIFVSKDGRDFALNRRDIKLCQKIVPSHAEGLTPGV